MSDFKPSEKQLDDMRHALGVNQGAAGSRNHFCTGPGSTDWDDWNELTEHGLAVRHDPPAWCPDYFFCVTDAGRRAIKEAA